MATFTTACDAVFETCELAQDIFSYLSTTELARAQRVCPKWKSAITGSDALNQTLFLRAVDRKHISLLGYRGHPYRPSDYYIRKTIDDSGRQTETILSLHPALRYCEDAVPHRRSTMGITERGFSININSMLRWPPGQWEHAFITQPPCPSIKFFFSHGLPSNNKTKKYASAAHYISAPDGIQLGHIKRAVCAKVPRGPLRLWYIVDFDFECERNEHVIFEAVPKVINARQKQGGVALAENHEARQGWLPLEAGEGEKEWLGVDDIKFNDDDGWK